MEIRNTHYRVSGFDGIAGNVQAQEELDELISSGMTEERGLVLKSFPDGGCNGWTISEFGPLYIPAKGSVVGMNPETRLLYRNVIEWEQKKELVESGEIDCIMGCFSMEGRLDDYRWAGPYIASRQVVAVNENSDIYKLSDLEEKNLAVQSTTKPEGIFLNRTDERIPKLGNLISLGHRELIYTFLGKGYVDAVAAHEESIVQYMKDYDASFRILEEPLMITGIGVAFAKDDDRGICEQMSQTLEEMRQDGTSLKIIGKYLDDPQKYLEVDDLGY